MAVCNTCGNSSGLPCGCAETSLTTNCLTNVDFGCSPLANQCAEAYCMECVQPCSKEDNWNIKTINGIQFTAGKNESLTELFQKLMLSQVLDANQYNENLISLFYSTNVTSNSIQFVWNYSGSATITGFQISYVLVTNIADGFTPVVQVPNASATSATITTSLVELTSGLTYRFRINTISAGSVVVGQQSVNLDITIP
tara:strand:+ start:176 stop:769 length:594 start_codon:yes stop_codon:yes gene_type:complete